VKRITQIHNGWNDRGDADDEGNNGDKANGITVYLRHSMWFFHDLLFYKFINKDTIKIGKTNSNASIGKK
jgi:hypothetical protein